MNKISTSDIKKLRDLTGAGFLDCKNALDETNSDFDKAIECLRKKGISSAQKKSDRDASEGLVAISTNESNKEAGIVEINSETDFVARNDNFQSFVSNISKINLDQKGDLDKVIKSQYNKTKDNVSNTLTNLISKIGENLSIRRTDYINSDDGFVGTYIHNVEKDNMGKIGVLVSIKTDIEYSKITDFLKKICMHIAATNPIAITSSDIDQDTINKEKEFQLEEIKKSKKDQSIQEKILEGKMNKYFNEVVLLEQNFVVDDSIKIKQFIENISKEFNGSIEIKKFVRFKVGEGI
jgi:elongation factor Ts